MHGRLWLLAAALALPWAGCDDNNTNNTQYDLSFNFPSPGPKCTAGAKECVSDRVARICPSDGADWLPLQCAADETCKNGDCVAGAQICTSFDDTCSGNKAVHCMVDPTMGFGTTFTMTDCPAGTTCFGSGQCKGKCVAGSSFCDGSGKVVTCATDGQSFTTSQCNTPNLEFCVDTTTNSDQPTAACKPSTCVPDPNGCDFVCGNRANPAATGEFMSLCQQTPNGYQWLPVACGTGETCNPNASACISGPGSMASCTSECTNGQQRCSSDFMGIQTCSNNKWGNVVACAPVTGPAKYCMADANNPGQQLCAHPICFAGFAGACDSGGNFRPCQADGSLGTAAACPTGICLAADTSNVGTFGVDFPADGSLPGACISQCKDGESKCEQEGGTTKTTCTSGRWSAGSQCASSAVCFTGTNDAGAKTALCGAVCKPGSHRCVTGSGVADGGINDGGVSNADSIEVCGNDGQWGTATACATGLGCVYNDDQSDAFCEAECAPGSDNCVGDPQVVAGAVVFSSHTKCSADGRLIGTDTESTTGPDGRPYEAHVCNGNPNCVDCAGDTLCRRDTNGKFLGCLECVGSTTNESGFVDSQCTGPNTIQTCKSDNTWGVEVTCGNGSSCQDGTPPTPKHCAGVPGYSDPMSESQIESDSGGSASCFNLTDFGLPKNGVPIKCGDTPDCCDIYCVSGAVPTQCVQ